MANQVIENILLLPDEMLMMIVGYIPQRYNIAETCQRLYEIVCAVEYNKCRLFLFRELDLKLASLMNTKRTFDEIYFGLPETHHCVEVEVLHKFGTNIKSITFKERFKRSECQFVELLHLMPNLEAINFQSSYGISSQNRHEIPSECHSDIPINLPLLRCINNDSEQNLKFFAKRLPPNLLVELSLNRYLASHIDRESIYELLTRQLSIQRLHIYRMHVNEIPEVIKQFNLTHLTYQFFIKSFTFLKELLTLQPNLVVLCLLDESSYTHSTYINHFEIIKLVSKMSHLNTFKLTTETINYNTFGEVKQMKFTNLKTLGLFSRWFQIELSFVLKNFSSIEELEISLENSSNICHYINDDCSHSKLKFLKLSVHNKSLYNEDELDNLHFNLLPNLKTFKLCERFPRRMCGNNASPHLATIYRRQADGTMLIRRESQGGWISKN